MRDWAAMAIVLAVLGAMVLLLKALERSTRVPAELPRKLLHVGMGVVVLTFPWVFDHAWPVVLLSGVATAALLTVKLLPQLRDGVGSVMTRVKRPTFGEVYFPISVGVLFWASGGDPLLFCVPMLILTFADAVAALIGIGYGRVRYVTSDGLKSAEGSIAFFAVAFLGIHVPLLLSATTGRAESLLIAAIIGLLATVIEAIAWRGLDNLAIPLSAFAFLKLYQYHSVDDLLVRLVATVALLIFTLAWRRRSSLDDSALLGSALFGYGAWMLCGWPWLVGPVALLVVHGWLWPRCGDDREHSIYVLLSVIGPALLWLGAYVYQPTPLLFLAYAVGFGVHLTNIGLSRCGRDASPGQWAAWAGRGWLLAAVQLIVFGMFAMRMTVVQFVVGIVIALVVVMCGSAIFTRCQRRLTVPAGTACHLIGFVIGAAGSGAAVLAAWGIQKVITR